jgi:hypothetical protein
VAPHAKDLEHRFKKENEVEQHTPGQLPGPQGYARVIPTGRPRQLPPQSVVDELYVLG